MGLYLSNPNAGYTIKIIDAFAVHYSRNHMKTKGGKAARPKFHVFFAIDRVTEPGQYSEMKKLVNTIFPYFDTKALDAARFFFGTKEPEVEIFDGPMTLTTFLTDDDFDANMDSGSYGDPTLRRRDCGRICS